MKGWLVNLVLLIAAIALGAYVYFKPADENKDQHAIATLTPAQVTKLSIEHGQDSMAFEKKDNMWFMVTPMAARADAGQVNRILDVLAVKSKDKLAAGDLARFDLDKPAVKLRLDAHGIAFGTTNSLTQDQYVLSGDSVFLIPSFYGTQIPQKPDQLLTHSLLTESEKITGIELPQWAAEKQDGKWTITRPAPGQAPLSQDDLNRWADDWRFSSSLLTQPYDGKAGREQVHLKLEGGKRLTLEVLQTEPSVVLARADEKLKFQYSSEAGKRLLKPEPEPLPDTPSSGVAPSKP